MIVLSDSHSLFARYIFAHSRFQLFFLDILDKLYTLEEFNQLDCLEEFNCLDSLDKRDILATNR